MICRSLSKFNPCNGYNYFGNFFNCFLPRAACFLSGWHYIGGDGNRASVSCEGMSQPLITHSLIVPVCSNQRHLLQTMQLFSCKKSSLIRKLSNMQKNHKIPNKLTFCFHVTDLIRRSWIFSNRELLFANNFPAKHYICCKCCCQPTSCYHGGLSLARF